MLTPREMSPLPEKKFSSGSNSRRCINQDSEPSTLHQRPILGPVQFNVYRSPTSCQVCLYVGCLTSQQQARVSQGRIRSHNFTCCHTEIEAADPTSYGTQLQCTDTGQTNPSADHLTPGAQQGSCRSATGMTRPGKKSPQRKRESKPALMLPSKLSSLRTPCPSCRPSSQIGTLKSMTCLLLLPHFVDAMKSPYNGYHLTATCLEMRLLTLWQRRAQQKSKWIDPPATLR